MRAYLDSSIILRIVLGQPDRLAEWHAISAGVTSRLAEVECLRVLDRVRLMDRRMSDEDLAARRGTLFRIFESLQLVEVSANILNRAAQPMPVPLGTLDAIHLATAQLWRASYSNDLVVATHDRAFALAALSDGFRTIGS